MSKTNILVISNRETNNDSALSAWTQIPHSFHLDIAATDEAAIELFHKQPFDMVVVDCTDSSINYKKLNAVLPVLQEDTVILPYRGETEQELGDNVKAVLNARKYQRMQRIVLLEPAITSSLNLPPFSSN